VGTAADDLGLVGRAPGREGALLRLEKFKALAITVAGPLNFQPFHLRLEVRVPVVVLEYRKRESPPPFGTRHDIAQLSICKIPFARVLVLERLLNAFASRHSV
jgi:hypothetical protein